MRPTLYSLQAAEKLVVLTLYVSYSMGFLSNMLSDLFCCLVMLDMGWATGLAVLENAAGCDGLAPKFWPTVKYGLFKIYISKSIELYWKHEYMAVSLIVIEGKDLYSVAVRLRSAVAHGLALITCNWLDLCVDTSRSLLEKHGSHDKISFPATSCFFIP